MYPQNQLLEDLESSRLFYLYAESSQLRCILAKLTGRDARSDFDAGGRCETIAKAMRNIKSRYTQFFPTNEHHPHLAIDEAIIGIPSVQPGDYFLAL